MLLYTLTEKLEQTVQNLSQTKLTQHSLKGRNILIDRTPNPPSAAFIPSAVCLRCNNSEYKIGCVSLDVGNAYGNKNTKKTNIWAVFKRETTTCAAAPTSRHRQPETLEVLNNKLRCSFVFIQKPANERPISCSVFLILKLMTSLFAVAGLRPATLCNGVLIL